MTRFTGLKSIRFKGQVYAAGELLPETFTANDKSRHLWSRKIIMVEVPQEEEPQNITHLETIENLEMNNPSKEIKKIATNECNQTDQNLPEGKFPAVQTTAKK